MRPERRVVAASLVWSLACWTSLAHVVARRVDFEHGIERALALTVLSVGGVEAGALIAGFVVRDLSPDVLAWASGAAFASFALVLRAGGRGPGTSVVSPGPDRSSAAVRLGAATAGATVVGQTAWRFAIALRTPPLDWDGLGYHLVSVAAWTREHAVVAVPAISQADAYPRAVELLATAVVSFDGGRGRLVDAVQLVAVPMGVLAVAAAARWAGRTSATAILSGCLFGLTPVVLAQLSTAYVDVVAAAAVLSGWYFVAAGVPVGPMPPHRSRARLLVGGVAMGLAVGSKATMLLPGLLGLIVVLAVTMDANAHGRLVPELGVAGGGPHRRARRAAGLVAAFAGPMLLIGAPWYVWNVVRFGNPTHPFDVGLGPLTLVRGPGGPASGILAGQRPDTVRHLGGFLGAVAVWWEDVRGARYFYDSPAGLGPQWTLVMLPATVWVIAMTWSRRARSASRRITFGYLLPVVVCAVVTPGLWWARLSLPIVGAGIVATGVAVAELWTPGSSQRLRRGIAVAAVVIVGAGTLLGMYRVTATHRLLTVDVTASRMLAVVDGRRSPPFGEASSWPEHRFSADTPAGTVIAATPSGLGVAPYGLVGDRFQNELLPLATFDDAASLRTALAALDRRADLVVVGDPAERGALLEQPDRYCLVADVAGRAAFSTRVGDSDGNARSGARGCAG